MRLNYKHFNRSDPLYTLKAKIAEIGLRFFQLTESLKFYKNLKEDKPVVYRTDWFVKYTRLNQRHSLYIYNYLHYVSVLSKLNYIGDIEKLIEDTEASVIKLLAKFNMRYK